MPMIGFSDGKDITESAPLEDFLLFFETLRGLHEKGYKQYPFAKTIGKGEFPLMMSKLFRGFVPFDEIDTLENEVINAKNAFSMIPSSFLKRPSLSSDSQINLSKQSLSGVFERMFDGIEHSIEGSREYNNLGHPALPVKIIVSEIPSALTMLRMSEEDYNQKNKPPIWTYYGNRVIPR